MTTRLTIACGLIVACALAGAHAPAHASAEKASIFYEDALKKFEREDFEGAVIQLKNVIKEDQRMLPAHLLLGKALIRDGQLKAAEAALEEAIRQGVDRSEVVVPIAQINLALGFPAQVIEKAVVSGLPAALKAEVLSLRGTAYAQMGNVRQASESFSEARAADPSSIIPLVAEVPVLLGASQYDTARTVAQKARDMAPNSAGAWNMVGSVAHATGDLKGALAAYDKALAIEPKFVEVRVARAALLIDLKREDDAMADLEFIKARTKGEPRSSYLRALLLAKRGEQAQSKAALGEAVRMIDALPPAWLSTREQLLMVGALSHQGLRNLEKAREYLEILIGRNGRNNAARKLLASIYVERRDFLKAQPILESLIKIMPDDPQVQYMLGTTYMGRSRYVQATELLERAAARTGAPQMTRALGFSQLGLGKLDIGQGTLEKAFASSDSDDTSAGSALALLYLKRGLPEKAVRAAEAMVRRYPDNPAQNNFLGTIQVAAGQMAAGRATFEKVLAKSPDFRPAILNLVKLDAKEGRFDEGRRRLGVMLAKRSDDPEALYEFGLLEQLARNPAEAARHLTKASEVQRRDPRAGLALIDFYLGRREPAQALEAAKAAAAKYPDNMQVQMALGRTLVANGDAGAARNVYQQLTRNAEFDPEVQVAIGRLQLAAGNPDGAFYNAQKALQGRPDDAGALALLVEVESVRGNGSKADAAMKTLSAVHAGQMETLLASAGLAMYRGQFAVAANGYRAALAKEDSTANALSVARAHLAGGESPKAITFLAGWVSKRPKDTLALKALAEAQYRAGKFEDAKRNYAKAIEVDPDDPVTLNNYANLLLEMGDPGARAYAEKLVKLAPNNPSFVDTLGWVLVRQDQVDAGLRYLREARVRAPDDPEIRFHLAYALRKAGRMAEAREELRVALSASARVSSPESLAQLKRELGL